MAPGEINIPKICAADTLQTTTKSKNSTGKVTFIAVSCCIYLICFKP